LASAGNTQPVFLDHLLSQLISYILVPNPSRHKINLLAKHPNKIKEKEKEKEKKIFHLNDCFVFDTSVLSSLLSRVWVSLASKYNVLLQITLLCTYLSYISNLTSNNSMRLFRLYL